MATKLSGSLCRVLAIEDSQNELEVALNENGDVEIRLIIPGKRRKTKEDPVTFNLHEVFDGAKPVDTELTTKALQRVLTGIATSDFGDDPKKCGYLAVVKTMSLFKEAFGLNKTTAMPED